VTITTPFHGQFVVRRLGLAMINMYTIFEVSSLSCSRYIFGGLKSLKWVTWHDHAHFRDVLSSVGWDNPHIKYEMSTITRNEEKKSNAKCKNSRFEPPFGGLRGNAQGSSMARWKARCRLPISANWFFLASSHGCGTIKRNLSKSAFSDGGGSL